MKTVLGLLFFICLDIPAFAGYKTIGFKTSTLSDRQTDRPLELVVKDDRARPAIGREQAEALLAGNP